MCPLVPRNINRGFAHKRHGSRSLRPKKPKPKELSRTERDAKSPTHTKPTCKQILTQSGMVWVVEPGVLIAPLEYLEEDRRD